MGSFHSELSSPPKNAESEPELPLAFGKDVLKEFLLDPGYHNLNHCMC